MPFKSEAQRRWMYENHLEMAKEWEAETPKDKPLPENKSAPKRKPRSKKSGK